MEKPRETLVKNWLQVFEAKIGIGRGQRAKIKQYLKNVFWKF